MTKSIKFHVLRINVLGSVMNPYAIIFNIISIKNIKVIIISKIGNKSI